MEIDARINAVRPKVAAARTMISQVTPRNEDQRRKIRAAGNLLNGCFFPNLERLTGKMIEHDLNGDRSAS